MRREIALHSAVSAVRQEVESPMCECELFTIAEVMFLLLGNPVTKPALLLVDYVFSVEWKKMSSTFIGLEMSPWSYSSWRKRSMFFLLAARP